MLSVKEKLKPPGDRYTGNEYIEAWDMLPEAAEGAIPQCMFKSNKGLRYDILRILLYVMIKREDANITLQQVGEGMCEENLRELLEDALYFWTDQSKEEIHTRNDEIVRRALEADQAEDALDRAAAAQADPTA